MEGNVTNKNTSAISKAISELTDSEEENEIIDDNEEGISEGESVNSLSDFIEEDSQENYDSSSDENYTDNVSSEGEDESDESKEDDENEEQSHETDLDIDEKISKECFNKHEILPATTNNKRIRKPVNRYQDSHFTERMLVDVPEEEVEAVLNEEDPYFCQKFRNDLSESEEEESQTDIENGYNTDDYEERDNLHKIIRKNSSNMNVLHSNENMNIVEEDSDNDNDLISGPIIQFLTKKQPKENIIDQQPSKILLKDLIIPRQKENTIITKN